MFDYWRNVTVLYPADTCLDERRGRPQFRSIQDLVDVREVLQC